MLTKRSQQSDRLPESQCSGPPKGPFFTGSWSQLRSRARHTLSNQQAQLKKLRLVNLTENAERQTFKAPWCCFGNAPYSELAIVCTINVSIDCKKNEVPNLNQEKNILDCNTRLSVALFVFCF